MKVGDVVASELLPDICDECRERAFRCVTVKTKEGELARYQVAICKCVKGEGRVNEQR